jgi:hypothetical protein
MASPKSIKQIVNDAKSAAQLNVDFEREYGRKPNSNEGADLTNFWLKKTSNSSSASSGSSSSSSSSTNESPSGNSFVGGFSDALKGTVNFANKGIELTTGFIQQLYKSQLGSGKENDSTLKILDIVKGGISTGTVSKLLETAGDEIITQLTSQSKIYTDISTKIGMSGELTKELNADMISAQAEAKRYGFELENLAEFYTNMSDSSGKFALINKKTLDNAAPVAAQLGKTMGELATTVSTFENVGLGADKTLKSLGEAGVRAVSLGLNAQKVAKGMEENIGSLNQYGFKNGIQGLERMVQKSIEFKLSMDKVAKVAEDVMNPEGAIDMAAKLQILGGAVGSLGDPIKMMYESTNNMEGLQDSIIGAAGSLATYNKEQGRFEITGINLRRGREMAGALGMTMEELGRTAIATQERMAASTALMSRGLNIEEKDKEFLTNLSRMDGGEMKIMVPESIAAKLGVPTELALDKLDQKTADALLKNQKEFEKMSPADMAQKQLTEMERMGRSMDVVATWAKIQAANFIKGGVNEALGKEMAKMRDMINNDLKPKADAKVAMKEGAKIGRKLAKGDIADAVNELPSAAKKTFETQKSNRSQNQEPSVQKVEHEINIKAADVPGDYYKEVIKRNPAVSFASVNPKEWTQVDIANKKGK